MGDNAEFRVVVTESSLLTTDEIRELAAYASSGFERVNQALRGEIEMTELLRRRAELIRSALRKYPLAAAVRVTRRVGHAAVPGFDESDPDSFSGTDIEFGGFLSTCMNAVPPRMADAPLILELLVPEGTPAFALGALAKYPEERELLVIDARVVTFIEVEFDVDEQAWRLLGLVWDEG
ncbi:ADP-ribosyltransferase [Gordonia sihwensis]|uniref:ADP-ribosyltransferase n=1 Tax=Gordonia sihwensis TaxID=173559 RepID=UPI003D952A96